MLPRRTSHDGTLSVSGGLYMRVACAQINTVVGDLGTVMRMEDDGIEPTTSALQRRRSPS